VPGVWPSTVHAPSPGSISDFGAPAQPRTKSLQATNFVVRRPVVRLLQKCNDLVVPDSATNAPAPSLTWGVNWSEGEECVQLRCPRRVLRWSERHQRSRELVYVRFVCGLQEVSWSGGVPAVLFESGLDCARKGLPLQSRRLVRKLPRPAGPGRPELLGTVTACPNTDDCEEAPKRPWLEHANPQATKRPKAAVNRPPVTKL